MWQWLPAKILLMNYVQICSNDWHELNKHRQPMSSASYIGMIVGNMLMNKIHTLISPWNKSSFYPASTMPRVQIIFIDLSLALSSHTIHWLCHQWCSLGHCITHFFVSLLLFLFNLFRRCNNEFLFITFNFFNFFLNGVKICSMIAMKMPPEKFKSAVCQTIFVTNLVVWYVC